MIHKLIPVFREDYNMLQIVVRHEHYEDEEKTGYYMYISLLQIVEGKEPNLKDFKTHARQFVKKSKEDTILDATLNKIISEYRLAINEVFDISLLERDF